MAKLIFNFIDFAFFTFQTQATFSIIFDSTKQNNFVNKSKKGI